MISTEETRAYKEGIKAYEARVNFMDNPYHMTDQNSLHRWWNMGYKEAQRAI